MANASRALEPGGDEMRAMAGAAADIAARFVDDLANAPAFGHEAPASLLAAMEATPPEAPARSLAEALALVDQGARAALDTSGPGSLAFVPSGGLYAAAVADFVACVFNRYVPVAVAAPALSRLETSVTRWLCDELGLPAAARGTLTSGGTSATATAIAVARAAAPHRGRVLLTSELVHVSVEKAARLAGAGPVVRLPTDRSLRLDAAELERAVVGAESERPLMVVATSGTTDAGSVDRIEAVLEVARRHDLWVHVDAAYGGFFALTDQGRRTLGPIGEADSVALDPHKGMSLPFGTGCLLVRDGARLAAVCSAAGASYADNMSGPLPDPIDYSPECSREFRGLRIWLPLQLYGIAAFREALAEKLDLARRAYERLAAVPELELPFPPELSVVLFRARVDGDAPTREVVDRVCARQRVAITTVRVKGSLFGRMCILSHRTHADRVDEAVELIAAAARDTAPAAAVE